MSSPNGYHATNRVNGHLPADDPLRPPPHNAEAEECVIGSILLDNDTIPEVTEILRPADFYRDSLRTIYEAAIALHAAGVPVDSITLLEDLQRQGKHAKVGGDDAVVAALQRTPHASSARYYANIVREKAIARATIAVANGMLRDAYSNSMNADDLLEAAEKAVYGLGERELGACSITIGKAAQSAMDAITARTEGRPYGLSTGFRDLDALTHGLPPSEVVVLAARPSAGKSAIALNIAESIAVRPEPDARSRVLFFSLEMGHASLAERCLAGMAGIPGNKLRAGELSGDDLARLGGAYDRLQSCPLEIEDRPGRTMAQIAAIARRSAGRNNLALVIIDYLQLVTIEAENRRTMNREQQVADISRRVKDLARDLKIPIILLAQLNREVDNRADHRPMLSDLRESGAIEQDADQVWAIHRPGYYKPADQSLKGLAELIVLKNRNGRTDTVRLSFNDALTRFGDWHANGHF